MLKICAFLLLCALFSFLPRTAKASGETITLGGVTAVYWAPPPSPSKQPIILFSHGFKGCATQSTFLTEALAADGYWVFAPNHRDAVCRGGGSKGFQFTAADARFFQPDTWNDTTYADRKDDMRNLWTALQHDPRFQDKIDFTRLGLMGHSLGGYTVLGLAGAWPSWKMPEVRAVLALSPYSEPFNIRHTLGNLSVPVMFQGGTNDLGITPFVGGPGGSFEQTHGSKYFVNFQGAAHFAWTNMIKGHQAAIVDYSEAFLDHYLKGAPAAPDLTAATPDVAELRYDFELGSNVPKR